MSRYRLRPSTHLIGGYEASAKANRASADVMNVNEALDYQCVSYMWWHDENGWNRYRRPDSRQDYVLAIHSEHTLVLKDHSWGLRQA